MKTIGHHACSSKGGDEVILEKAPFLAEHNPEEDKYQFLGTGYYFWDNNKDLAKIWGRSRYDNNYRIIAIDFELTQDNCYDLVGNRSHQIDLVNKMKLFDSKQNENKSENWTVNQCITFLRTLAKKDKAVFPYDFIRAVDLLNHKKHKKAQKQIEFIKEKQNYTEVILTF
ncbi:hypothetical protein [Myroides marinus]|uniref:hypothetical protein n=1 Tax=Myroides marinus TaxID=703342 RepID=UPI002574D313|nr:hypothetical protein [Myroides marinus]MDM1373853.1 hypothetical protein [Myroides marinus]